ncbi:hypothetical protein RSAG8_08828, partial [Rhizoctonia solani AG-8 WAC10335]
MRIILTRVTKAHNHLAPHTAVASGARRTAEQTPNTHAGTMHQITFKKEARKHKYTPHPTSPCKHNHHHQQQQQQVLRKEGFKSGRIITVTGKRARPDRQERKKMKERRSRMTSG